ncbi:MAG: xanthine dehydrogenase accessory protein XdhC, partial [Hyphomicrobiales bacterium]|nr:xanthine dehydrogenase accessory protein XdhC [Hyphomicrobiales bacterium]
VTVEIARADRAALAALAEREARARDARPHALVFGAGHTGRALSCALAPLPLAVTLVDDREGVLDGLPAEVAMARLDDPGLALAAAPAGAAFVALTHSHALDYRLVDMALRRGDAAYVGMIGSATKRARFAASFRASGGTEAALARLTCPIGGADVRDKRPEVIAALAAAEIVRATAAR